MTPTNRRDYFYKIFKDGLQGLLKFDSKMSYLSFYNESKLPLCCIELLEEDKTDRLNAELNMTFTKATCEFFIGVYQRIQFNPNNIDTYTTQVNALLELVENEIYKIKSISFDIKDSTGSDFYNIKIYEFSINKEFTLKPIQENQIIGILISGVVNYSQTYYY